MLLRLSWDISIGMRIRNVERYHGLHSGRLLRPANLVRQI
jgi:hypothetical protein